MKIEKGFSTPALIAIIAAVIVIGGVVYFNMRPEGEIVMGKGETMVKDGTNMMHKGDTMAKEGSDMMKKGEGMMATTTMMQKEGYTGTVLAGTAAPLLDFNKADYEKALTTHKLIVLYFYANWCPICKVEFPQTEAAFNALSNKNVIGFRVNFNDSDTDQDEVALARQFGVSYQHTKIFVKDNARVLKSPESWDTARYLAEITKALSQ